eukprot:CAMPEP_0197841360 /NCGR_PEP_ID=MMETSP1437-20131217/46128_1 /TAXON_ID=49252 ORGANISM="Eucampia antarctica, Strain CCMP1452" /NCGR_SAMPLE_ID=MMETSP1437 /ASSEMBLY_ACC=CAM_ASM_001096 /LENGTH=486 /DNA_ID=CAMNT_0043451093 /DNA_START=15 /DNA_END=1475 /DNA_ORIENTATION=-
MFRMLLSTRKRSSLSVLLYLFLIVTTPVVSAVDDIGGTGKDSEGNVPWSGMGSDNSVKLLIRWKVLEEVPSTKNNLGDEMNVLHVPTAKSFTEILKKKSSLLRNDDGTTTTSSSTNTDHDDANRLLEQADDTNVQVVIDIPSYGITAVEGPVSFFEEIQLNQHEAVDLLELDHYRGVGNKVENMASSNAPVKTSFYNNEIRSYALDMIQSSSVPISTNAAMKVCIVDTGYNNGHPDLPFTNTPGHSVEGTEDKWFEENWYNDYNGHGTHVAGIIFAIGNNIGTRGVNPDPKSVGVVVGKAMNKEGGGTSGTVMGAVTMCLEKGAKIINLSIGGTEFSAVEKGFYEKIYNQDVLLIAAAGNTGIDEYFYPASHPTLISVASMDIKGRWSKFSTFNNQVEIAAPGSNIISTYPGNTYEMFSGTSAAVPHVSGVISKVWAHFPECTNNEIRMALIKSATPSKLCNNLKGHGLVQASDFKGMGSFPRVHQ